MPQAGSCHFALTMALAAVACGDPPGPVDAGVDAARCVALADGRCGPDDGDDDDDGALDADDCAPRDPSRSVELEGGECAADDEDDDDDGAPDRTDCASLDPAGQVELADGRCVADDGDDDDDGAPDDEDCAPLDAAASVTLLDGRCARDDGDDDDDGAPDDDDCAPRDAARSVTLATGACVDDDEDDDDDGAHDDDDCAPLDPALRVALTTGACVGDDDDDDDDGALDADDCAPTDPAAWLALTTGACVADDEDDDDDGALDADDCAPRDPALAVTLASGTCAADDADDDDDGAPDATDCAPLDASRSVPLSTGACAADDDDDDDDGTPDAGDCAPADPSRSVALAGGACAADDDDDDDDGVLDVDDCAPIDAARQVSLRGGVCVADDADDDDDGSLDTDDCTPRDARWQRGPCTPGAVERRACGSAVGECVAGEQSRACRDSCYFGPWGACGGAYVPPRAERCDAPGDEDCDGAADEGCGCDPVPPGAPGSFAVAGDLRNLRVDPVRCLAYAIDASADALDDSALVVLDTRLKAEVVRLPYGHGVYDFDVSPDGARLAVARYDVGRIDVIEPPVWAPTRSYAAGTEPHSVEIGAGGHAYFSRGSELFVLELATGAVTRVPWVASSPTLELSPDGTALYAGAFNSASPLYRFDVAADGSLTYVERSVGGAFAGFAKPTLTVSADGALVAWAGHLVDAFDLRFLHGYVPWHLDAFDATGRFVAAGGGVVDVGRMRPAAAPFASETVALVSADHELWWHDATTGTMHYANVADFVDLATLGRREWPPLPLADYDFTSLEVDPVRPWLYAVDGARGEVVVFDRATLAPLAAIEVGGIATDVALDPSGGVLYTGHHETWGVARVDLGELAYAGLARTHVRPTELAVVRTDRVVAAGDGTSPPSLIAPSSGTILDQPFAGYSGPTLAASGDGATVYLAESGTSASCLHVLDTAADALTELRTVDCVPLPPRGVAAVPGTPDVFWANARRATTTGAVAYALPEPIRTVTPDARLAISTTAIYDAATGARLATLPAASAAQALSPDGRTLYLGLPGAIRVVSLASHLP